MNKNIKYIIEDFFKHNDISVKNIDINYGYTVDQLNYTGSFNVGQCVEMHQGKYIVTDKKTDDSIAMYMGLSSSVHQKIKLNIWVPFK